MRKIESQYTSSKKHGMEKMRSSDQMLPVRSAIEI